jgi:hypothetical protein
MGSLIEMFYEYPILILLLVAAVVAVGIFVWRKKKSTK